MALNDELYSRLVNLYQDLDDNQIHDLNARLILLLSEKVSDSLELKIIIDRISAEIEKLKNS
ncbi:MAG: hypothetical protein CMM15_10185 [Rhodospirillaceae bacterium]|nr:hypothetical protein [Rhodospirillaceae bacterium]OUU21875.1 MAG: hypothetical protein CBB97_15830 [Candidatus Endolissoclinum sp. TMED37]|tara:strand:+ start:375 stop:560 length:186 start_codon:yes stop_codon:yes gene_type:complete